MIDKIILSWAETFGLCSRAKDRKINWLTYKCSALPTECTSATVSEWRLLIAVEMKWCYIVAHAERLTKTCVSYNSPCKVALRLPNVRAYLESHGININISIPPVAFWSCSWVWSTSSNHQALLCNHVPQYSAPISPLLFLFHQCHPTTPKVNRFGVEHRSRGRLQRWFVYPENWWLDVNPVFPRGVGIYFPFCLSVSN